VKRNGRENGNEKRFRPTSVQPPVQPKNLRRVCAVQPSSLFPIYRARAREKEEGRGGDGGRCNRRVTKGRFGWTRGRRIRRVGFSAFRRLDGSWTGWTFPRLDRRAETDASWAATLDTLRAPIRPVIFEDAGVLTDDTVHLHLEQRVAQRLLSRFRSQGFIHHTCRARVSRRPPTRFRV
jgi:hypothetical protein